MKSVRCPTCLTIFERNSETEHYLMWLIVNDEKTPTNAFPTYQCPNKQCLDFMMFIENPGEFF